jgi:hypothetical protein
MADPVAPAPQYLNLAEAVASLCPPLQEDAARRAIEEALCDGRLSEEPRPLWTAQTAQDVVALAYGDEKERVRGLAALMLSPPPTHPVKWQSRFCDSRVDWRTGMVSTAAGRRETPVFSRQQVSALFAAPEADAESVAIRPPRKREATQLPDVVKALRKHYGSAPPTANRKAMQEAVRQLVGREVSLATLDRARKTAWR